jgi:hypothetical protein
MSDFNRPLSHENYITKSIELFWADSVQDLPGLVVNSDLLKTSAKLYFSLNRAYKCWRVVEGHNTQPAKIAALTTVAIMLVRPILSVDGSESRELFYSNPFFALQTGCGIIRANMDALKEDTTLRIAGWLDTIRINSANSSISTIKTCIAANEFLRIEDAPVELNPQEVVTIDMIVSMFELIEQKTVGAEKVAGGK